MKQQRDGYYVVSPLATVNFECVNGFSYTLVYKSLWSLWYASGYIYWRLLSTSPQAAKEVVLAEKPLISEQTDCIEPDLLQELISNIGTLASIYHKPASTFVDGTSYRPTMPTRDADTPSYVIYYHIFTFTAITVYFAFSFVQHAVDMKGPAYSLQVRKDQCFSNNPIFVVIWKYFLFYDYSCCYPCPWN